MLVEQRLAERNSFLHTETLEALVVGQYWPILYISIKTYSMFLYTPIKRSIDLCLSSFPTTQTLHVIHPFILMAEALVQGAPCPSGLTGHAHTHSVAPGTHRHGWEEPGLNHQLHPQQISTEYVLI